MLPRGIIVAEVVTSKNKANKALVFVRDSFIRCASSNSHRKDKNLEEIVFH